MRACCSPLQAWKPDLGGSLIFSERAGYSPLTIRCGQCIGCRLDRSCQWAIRCMHENQMHEESAFITLTYDDKHLPVDNSLHYRDFQLFMKRLRRFYSLRQRIRFFMCGEYGELRARPHFHACIFGIRFDDRVLFKRLSSGCCLYTSDILTSLWSDSDGLPIGFSSVGDVTFESAAYIARYIVKKQFGDMANEHSVYRYVDDYGEVHYRMPEFAHMSLKPGIGYEWFQKFYPEVFPRDHVIVGGRKSAVPKYYDRLLAANDFGFDLDAIEFERFKKGLRGLEDSTPARLKARETVARALLAFKSRTLE